MVNCGFSALQRAEIAEMLVLCAAVALLLLSFSALQRAEIAEMCCDGARPLHHPNVSVLFNEPKLLKFCSPPSLFTSPASFSALQRAEIAEIIARVGEYGSKAIGFSALQRAEIAEI